MGIKEQIEEIEEEIKKTQYNKATEFHIGKLKAKVARLKREMEVKKGGSTKIPGVKKSGDATVVMVGFPNIGKSTLLNALTNADSQVADYEFTTLDVIPGMMNYNGANIQLLDLPGIIKNALEKGRGREVLSMARSADLILIMTEMKNPDPKPIEKELYDAGIRLNSKKPNIMLKKTDRDGIKINSTVKLRLDEKTIVETLKEFKIINANILFRQNVDIDEFIDFLRGNAVYIPSLYIINKSDLKSLKRKHRLMISALTGKGLDDLRKAIYDKLDFIKVYTCPKDEEPDWEDPLIVKSGTTIENVCRAVHRDFVRKFRYALISGLSAKFDSQMVGLNHVVEEGDIITFILKR